MSEQGFNSVFHYVPLHSSPAGKKLARCHGQLDVTDDMASRLVRLPLWVGLDPQSQNTIVVATQT